MLPDPLRCRFKVDEVNGLTPKFECELPDGEVVKVKYSGPEPYGEVAASRLLRTLGFGADRVSFVKSVRCYGCPRYPFPTLKLVTLVGAEKVFAKGLDYDSAVDFEWPSVERKAQGEKIETPEGRGWAFHELAKVPTASRVHADALTLMAIFLAHWDNKPENQRLVCLSGKPGRDGRCAKPLAMLQDVGGTFGPRKTDLAGWRSAPIWTNRAACTVSMKSLPHGGATFTDTAISERGRRFVADRLARLSDRQIRDVVPGRPVRSTRRHHCGMDGALQGACVGHRIGPALPFVSRRSFLSQHARIDRHPAARDRLEVHRVVGDLDEHEVEVPIEASGDRPSGPHRRRAAATRRRP